MCSDTALGRRSVCPETVFDSFRQNREQPGKLVALRLPVIPLKGIHVSGQGTGCTEPVSDSFLERLQHKRGSGCTQPFSAFFKKAFLGQMEISACHSPR